MPGDKAIISASFSLALDVQYMYIQYMLKRKSLWMGFNEPLGGPRSGFIKTSLITTVFWIPLGTERFRQWTLPTNITGVQCFVWAVSVPTCTRRKHGSVSSSVPKYEPCLHLSQALVQWASICGAPKLYPNLQRTVLPVRRAHALTTVKTRGRQVAERLYFTSVSARIAFYSKFL